MKRLLIVDGHAYAYRAFYAIRHLRSPSGQAVNGIFGFVKMLAKLRAGLGGQKLEARSEKLAAPSSKLLTPSSSAALGSVARWVPSHVLVVWDGGLSVVRVAAWPEYKAQRPEMPAELGAQLDEMLRFLAAANVASFCRDGVEADDYVACVARRAVAAGFEVVVASSDKDFMQLVTLGAGESGLGSGVKPEMQEPSPESRGWIGLWNPNDKSEVVWGAEQVRSKCGVEPSQVVDWLSLLGDSVDNIPGVPGVGAKTAKDLLGQFGSVEVMYGRLGEVKSERIRGALRAAEGAVRRNQALVRLHDDLVCDFSPETLAVRPVDRQRLAELYRGWGFRGLLAELEASSERQGELI